MPRLRRVRATDDGWARRRTGRGVVYLDGDGARIADPEVVARLKALAIPPAWREVWICPDELGHIQAIGTDDAGRRQYLYHPRWRANRDRAKHRRVVEVARRLPRARRGVTADLAVPGLTRPTVLALAFRLLDDAYFRAGGEVYAQANGSYGLATVRRDHVTLDGEAVVFHYPAKSGQDREALVEDAVVRDLVRALRDRDDAGEELLAWASAEGWHDVTTADIQLDVKDRLGPDATPKDFRTWHATVLAAQGLAAAGPPPASERGRRRVVSQVVRDVAGELGNTPAVCRASYIDLRLVDLWERGRTIGRTRSRTGAERAVIELLS